MVTGATKVAVNETLREGPLAGSGDLAYGVEAGVASLRPRTPPISFPYVVFLTRPMLMSIVLFREGCFIRRRNF